MANFFIRIDDQEAEAMLRKLARDNFRTIAGETVLLIREEYARQYSSPNAVVTVGEAVEAGAAINPMVAETD